MQYRTLGRTGLRVSAIGLGTEYLIDLPRDTVVDVIREAIAQGINYFDLFFAQPEFRDNMGVAFKGKRQQAILAAHLGSIHKDGQYTKTRDPKISEEFLLDFLTRYDTDHVDIAFLHNSDPQEDYDELMRPGGLLDLARRWREEGKARFIGMSGHTVTTSLQAVESGQIDVLMFPINLAGNAVPGKKQLLNACAAHNVGLVAMKPYAGGKLLQHTPAISMEDYQVGGDNLELEKPALITPTQCLSYVLTQVGVSTIVPGCKDLQQLAAALAYWDATEKERDFSSVLADFQQYATGECVYCNHCLPCPAEIDIGQTIRLLDRARHGQSDEVRALYEAMPNNASDCILCAACEERCPFEVAVIAKMEEADEVLG